MNKKDLLQISKLFSESFSQIWEGNIEPGLTAMENRLEKKIDETIDKKLANYPTKTYLDDKISDLKGDFNIKFNRLTGVLNQKRVLTDQEVETINRK